MLLVRDLGLSCPPQNEVKGINWKAHEKLHGGQFQVAVDCINQLTVESPVLSALIYYVFYLQSAGWPHWSQGSLPDITIALVWLVLQESNTNTVPPVLQDPWRLISVQQISSVIHSLEIIQQIICPIYLMHIWT